MKAQKIILSKIRRRATGHSFLFFLIFYSALVTICCHIDPGRTSCFIIADSPLLFLGIFTGYHSKKIRRFEISIWKKKFIVSKEWKEKFLRQFPEEWGSVQNLKNEEEKINFLKLIFGKFDSLEEGEGAQYSWDLYEFFSLLEQKLTELETMEMLPGQSLDECDTLLRQWDCIVKKTKREIIKDTKKIELFNSLIIA